MFSVKIELSNGSNIIYTLSLPWPQNPITFLLLLLSLLIWGASIATAMLTVFDYNALLHSPGSEWSRHTVWPQIQALLPSRACLSVCNTLGRFESPVMKFIQCYKNMWVLWLLHSQWSGIEGWRRPLCLHRFASTMACPEKLQLLG